MISQIFVYGTLRQGQCREACWPCRPLRVSVAFVRGQLYDLGPYPAMLEGEDRVRGECWTFDPDAIDATLRVLDAIEGFAQPEEADLYRRRVVDIFSSPLPDALPTARGYAYFLVPERLPSGARRIPMRSEADVRSGTCAYWPDAGRTVEETSSLADPFEGVP